MSNEILDFLPYKRERSKCMFFANLMLIVNLVVHSDLKKLAYKIRDQYENLNFCTTYYLDASLASHMTCNLKE